MGTPIHGGNTMNTYEITIKSLREEALFYYKAIDMDNAISKACKDFRRSSKSTIISITAQLL